MSSTELGLDDVVIAAVVPEAEILVDKPQYLEKSA